MTEPHYHSFKDDGTGVEVCTWPGCGLARSTSLTEGEPMDEKSLRMRAHDMYVLQHGPSCANEQCDHPRCFIVRTLRREAYPGDDANIAETHAGNRSPGLSQPAPRFVAVELLKRSSATDEDVIEFDELGEVVQWVIIEVPVTYTTKTAVMSYACTRALVTVDNESEWDLGSTVWVRNGTRLIPEQALKLPA